MALTTTDKAGILTLLVLAAILALFLLWPRKKIVNEDIKQTQPGDGTAGGTATDTGGQVAGGDTGDRASLGAATDDKGIPLPGSAIDLNGGQRVPGDIDPWQTNAVEPDYTYLGTTGDAELDARISEELDKTFDALNTYGGGPDDAPIIE